MACAHPHTLTLNLLLTIRSWDGAGHTISLDSLQDVIILFRIKKHDLYSILMNTQLH